MTFLQRIFGRPKQRDALQPLYDAIVAAARDPFWYREGGVPDTVDGRFDMVAAMLALALLRLEAEGAAAREETRLLTELFIDDMDASLRQMGIGDHVVGKHVGRMMGALGGRLDAFRAAREGGSLEAAVRRNIFHDSPPSEERVILVAARLEAWSLQIAAVTSAELALGKLGK